MQTRQELTASLEAQGVHGAALEAILKETAAARHAWRVAQARQAAEEYALEVTGLAREEASPAILEAQAGAILWADVVGIGGKDGVEGYASARHPALQGCGKGRKQASDGEAWSAAILEAARDIRGIFRVNENARFVFTTDRAETDLEELLPILWRRSLLREGLRRSAGIRFAHVRWADDGLGGRGLGLFPMVPIETLPGNLSVWAELVNEIEALASNLREVMAEEAGDYMPAPAGTAGTDSVEY